MEDSTDAISFNPLKWFSKGKPEKGEETKPDPVVVEDKIIEESIKVTEIGINDECYNMKHIKRGKAIIFNHYKFDNNKQPLRKGTDKDVTNLKRILHMLHFDVQEYTDLEYEAIKEILDNLSDENHADNDCLLIAILSHGNYGKVHARDEEYPIEELWHPFTGDKCPSLAGKPKIFLIQACRGSEVDDGVRIKNGSFIESDSNLRKPDTFYKIPSRADFLIMYATYAGYFAWRSCNTGSWFIECVCEALKAHVLDKDLMTILTIANRMVATEYKSCSKERSLHEKKQIGTIVSTCTRLVYLNDTKRDAKETGSIPEDNENKIDVNASELEKLKSDQKIGQKTVEQMTDENDTIDKEMFKSNLSKNKAKINKEAKTALQKPDAPKPKWKF